MDIDRATTLMYLLVTDPTEAYRNVKLSQRKSIHNFPSSFPSSLFFPALPPSPLSLLYYPSLYPCCLAIVVRRRWARDDPAFQVIIALGLVLSKIAYNIAFRVSSPITWVCSNLRLLLVVPSSTCAFLYNSFIYLIYL